MGRWSPCIDSRFPAKGPEHRMPTLAFPPIELKDENTNLTIDECMVKWPVKPPDEPLAVLVDPPKPPPLQGQGESLFFMPMTEVEPEKAKT